MLGILNLDFFDGENKREIIVFDARGQLGYSQKTKNASTQIHLKALNVIEFVMVQIIDRDSVTNHKVIGK